MKMKNTKLTTKTITEYTANIWQGVNMMGIFRMQIPLLEKGAL